MMRSNHPIWKWFRKTQKLTIGASLALLFGVGALTIIIKGADTDPVLLYIVVLGLGLFGILNMYAISECVSEIRKLRSDVSQLKSDQFTKEKEEMTGAEAQRQTEEIIKDW